MIPRRFLIDTNVFIDSKNFSYNFDYCRIFWDFLLTLHDNGLIYSIDKVKNEICNKEDPLCKWVKEELPATFFESEYTSMANYAKLINWSMSLDITDKAKSDFASQDKADAFLIAHAMTHDFTIITHEKASGGLPKKRILIPDAAAIHGVDTLTLFEFLPQYAGHNFSVK